MDHIDIQECTLNELLNLEIEKFNEMCFTKKLTSKDIEKLQSAGLKTVRDLCSKTHTDIAMIKYMRETTVDKISQALSSIKLQFNQGTNLWLQELQMNFDDVSNQLYDIVPKMSLEQQKLLLEYAKNLMQ